MYLYVSFLSSVYSTISILSLFKDSSTPSNFTYYTNCISKKPFITICFCDSYLSAGETNVCLAQKNT